MCIECFTFGFYSSHRFGYLTVNTSFIFSLGLFRTMLLGKLVFKCTDVLKLFPGDTHILRI